jgi:hypothetical protein
VARVAEQSPTPGVEVVCPRPTTRRDLQHDETVSCALPGIPPVLPAARTSDIDVIRMKWSLRPQEHTGGRIGGQKTPAGVRAGGGISAQKKSGTHQRRRSGACHSMLVRPRRTLFATRLVAASPVSGAPPQQALSSRPRPVMPAGGSLSIPYELIGLRTNCRAPAQAKTGVADLSATSLSASPARFICYALFGYRLSGNIEDAHGRKLLLGGWKHDSARMPPR